MLAKFCIFTNKYADVLLFISEQKEIEGLLKKDVFKIVTLKYVVMPEEMLSSIQVFNFSLYNDIKNPCIDKAYEKSCPIIHTYNNKKKNIVSGHLLQIPGVTKIPEVTQILKFSQSL